MARTCASPLNDYLPAFAGDSAAFLNYYSIAPDKSLRVRSMTRGEFWALACRAATLLRRSGLEFGDCHTHFFSGNTLADLAFRLASIMCGTTPVTINWQADTPEQVAHKIRVTESKLVLVDAETPADVLAGIQVEFPAVTIYNAEQLEEDESIIALPESQICEHGQFDASKPRIVIFTSGTTGNPKGVRLSYEAYRCNRLTFEAFLNAGDGKHLTAVVVNPLHHTNSTSITDWALRKPGARLHLIQRYSTQYWQALALAGTRLQGTAATVSATDDASLLGAIQAAPRTPPTHAPPSYPHSLTPSFTHASHLAPHPITPRPSSSPIPTRTHPYPPVPTCLHPHPSTLTNPHQSAPNMATLVRVALPY